MSEDVQDEHAFGPVVDSGDQSVVVTINIEYGSPPYYLRMSEIMLRVCQRIPVCSLLVIRYQFISGTNASGCRWANLRIAGLLITRT